MNRFLEGKKDFWIRLETLNVSNTRGGSALEDSPVKKCIENKNFFLWSNIKFLSWNLNDNRLK